MVAPFNESDCNEGGAAGGDGCRDGGGAVATEGNLHWIGRILVALCGRSIEAASLIVRLLLSWF